MTDSTAHRPVGILELGAVCARMRAVSLDLFEALGTSVAVTDNPALQRLYADAAHRHAWHAEVWEARTPTIPPVESEALTTGAGTRRDLVDRYGALLGDLIDELDELEARIDPSLDPTTHHVIGHVRTDLTDLRTRLSSLTR